MKKEIDIRENAGLITRVLQQGVLLNSKADGIFNSMVIGWGMIGVDWAQPVFITFVRTGRYTHELMEKNPEFTISVPVEGTLPKDIFTVCGRESGRNVNKAEKLGLTLVESDTVSVPGIKEVPLTLECEVIYRQDQCAEAIPAEIRDRFYKGILENNDDPEQAIHTMYFGKIRKAYIIE